MKNFDVVGCAKEVAEVLVKHKATISGMDTVFHIVSENVRQKSPINIPEEMSFLRETTISAQGIVNG